ncbi:hypothetical protein [Thermobispora bispora]|mgnify:CR=1 FL=1|uniref:LigA n=1 Tax=Thermobispora bispora (strain ATCC 19993 / DSM 43833 / CBS 139.67 / JCM 10125 / KCTC 9307 / NBRC 14880 / R51) TaxID=469371 RepID=D6Y9A9_THEBD|nr:hypothetical protein [Thermobispora bispora]ADG88029.1 hypothetical protein Tbis_1310 [Thermobispora bispora DSM 43833]MBO2474190.1 hypothetical protein [Actinomycetales bacterium]MDI9580543.1 hypothetical protein [Thermobispora sp.]QSI47897.1 hypothetical protein CYL17_08470 [Thermobispora bispora]
MTRSPKGRAVPLCALFAGLLAGPHLRPAAVAHAYTGPGLLAAQRTAHVEIARDWLPPRLQGDASLSDVAAVSATDIWAVGQQDVWDLWRNRGVIAHWNGSSWTEVPVRGDETGPGHLRSVAVAGRNDVWVVGDGQDGLPYVAHGSADGFSRVRVRELRSGDWLGAVAAASGRVVMVGSRDGKAFLVSLGKNGAWATAQGGKGAMYGVALSGKSDGWAVGDSGTRPLIMRLSGSGWKPASVPEVAGGYLRDVHVDGKRSSLAVGGVYRGGTSIAPLVLHWNGKKWRRLRLPVRVAELYGVTGDGRGTYWISGYDPRHPERSFLLKYDGRRWTTLRGRASGQKRKVRLQAVSHVSGLTVAVGHLLDAKDRYTDHVERYETQPAK